ncbi:MAG: transposase [Chloroflexi bacterium]|nr:transposase [Chloroflexota bacterium]
MENTGRLYTTLFQVVRHPHQWLDVRHAKTLTWMMVGLIQSGVISLTAWAPFVTGRAVYAQSTVRRFARWLDNDRIQVHQLYGPLIQQALAEWGEYTLYLALDTSMLWGRYCVIRVSVIFRGRAVPLVWTVLEHASSSVAYETYQGLLDRAATLLPLQSRVVFLADRGFVDTDLLAQLTRLGWHWRIRLKGNLWVYRPGQGRRKINRITLALGQALCWHHVYLTEQRYGPVHVALARRADGAESWFVVSDEPTTVDTFDEYGLRFDIEENFLDDKSNGFQLEASLIRSAQALTRLCMVLALTTLYLVAQGTAVVAEGKRRWVDPHWFRGSSYLKIGWQWVKAALAQGYALLTHVRLPGGPDPEPARASKQQDRCPPQRSFSVTTVRFG